MKTSDGFSNENRENFHVSGISSISRSFCRVRKAPKHELLVTSIHLDTVENELPEIENLMILAILRNDRDEEISCQPRSTCGVPTAQCSESSRSSLATFASDGASETPPSICSLATPGECPQWDKILIVLLLFLRVRSEQYTSNFVPLGRFNIAADKASSCDNFHPVPDVQSRNDSLCYNVHS